MGRPVVTQILLSIVLVSGSAAQVRSSPVRASESAMANRLTHKVAPLYPPLARQARIQGSVILQIAIDQSGDVVNVGLVSGHPMLAPAATEAVKQWKYSPYLLNGNPVAVETRVTVNFALSDNPPVQGVVGDAPGAVPPEEQPGIVTSPSANGTPAQRVRVSSGVSQGLLIRKVNPTYPPEARQQNIEGRVVMKATIDRDGNVSNVELISGHPLLAPAALEAVRQWKYQPYLLNGMPVVMETQVQVNFSLAP
jgi:TonB family protein